MAKFIEVKFSNGYVYHIPAEIIATNRAAYYAEQDSKLTGEDYTSVYNVEMELALSDEDHGIELLDWAHNNTDWKDVADRAVFIREDKKVTNFDEEWSNAKAKMRVVSE